MRVATMLVVVALAGCDRRPPIARCSDRLSGVWRAPDERPWMIVDNGPTLEGYPLFDDTLPPDGAPRRFDVTRGTKLAGTLRRRFMLRAQSCEARAPFSITSCTNDALQVVRGDLTSPLSYEPCAWPQALPSRVERWTRAK